jgi:hypothetical protein
LEGEAAGLAIGAELAAFGVTYRMLNR